LVAEINPKVQILYPDHRCTADLIHKIELDKIVKSNTCIQKSIWTWTFRCTKLPLFRRFGNGGSSPGTREEEKQLLLEAEQLLLARPKVDVVADAWASLVV